MADEFINHDAHCQCKLSVKATMIADWLFEAKEAMEKTVLNNRLSVDFSSNEKLVICLMCLCRVKGG